MRFEAESNGTKYEVQVSEARNHWLVCIKENENEWIKHEVTKENFQSLDDTISFIFKNSSYLIDVIGDGTDFNVFTRGSHREVKLYNDEMLLHESLKSGQSFGGGDSLNAGMPGKIVKIFVKPGDKAPKDGPLLIMEAMKMENEMRATRDLVIKEILVKENDTIESGAVLITFEAEKA